MGLTLAPFQKVFVDTAPFIYFFEEHEPYGARMAAFFDEVYDKDAEVVTSLVTYIELLTHPEREGDSRLAAKYRESLVNSERVSVYPLDLLVADVTVMYRARYGLKTPDAIQLATAQMCGADYVLTNDRDWSRVEGLNIVQVVDL